MQTSTRLRLSVMMFFEYFVQGTWYVTMATFLSKNLHCTDLEVGSAYAFTALAFIISPVFMGMIADKFFDSEKILGVLHLVGGVLLYFMSKSTDFNEFFTLLVIYMLLYAPTFALTSSIAIQQIASPEKDFPSIRVLGTIGWIAAGLFLGKILFVDEASAMPFLVGSVASFALGLYSFTLPKTPPKGKNSGKDLKSMLGLDAISMLKDAGFRTLLIAIFLIYIPITFYFQFASMFLNELGMKEAVATQTLGQISEIGFMLALPFFLVRLGLKPMILIGMAAWILRYVLFAFADMESNLFMIYGGIALHGVCYDFLFVSAQIYLDKKAPVHLRSSAQALMASATYGVGMFLGAYIAGLVGGNYVNTDNMHTWQPIWLAAAAGSALVLGLFAVFFKESK